MAEVTGGFALHNPQENKYVQFDGATIVFDTMEEIAEFKQTYRAFFTGTHVLPQIVAVDEAFVENGLCVRYSELGKELREEAREEVEEKYGDE